MAAPRARFVSIRWASRLLARCSICRWMRHNEEREGVSAMARETLAPWAERVPDRGPMTADELLAMGDSGKGCELVEGTLVRVAPTGFLHGMSVSRLNAAVTLHVTRQGSGVVVGAETGFVLSRPGTADTVLAPDVAYV